MSFLDELKQARESAASAYHLFLLEYPKSKLLIHTFFEGHDDFSFYRNFLLRFTNNPNYLRTYKCGNKQEVYDTYNKIAQGGHEQTITLFFVDKDHSDLIGEVYPVSKNIFVTDYYSIENYLVSDDMLQKVWEELFSFTNVRIDFSLIKEKFLSEQASFYNLVRPISAWIIYLRRNHYRPNTNNINLSRVMLLSDDLCIQMVDPDSLVKALEKMCGVNTPDGCEDALQSMEKELEAIPPKMHLRGKLELWFFVRFVEKLPLLIQRNVLEDGQSIKVRTQIGDENAIEILGPRMQMPDSIVKFLSLNIPA